MVSKPSIVIAIAGPNGAGKSTTAPFLLQEALAVSEFVNADAIAAGISAFRPEAVAIAAGRIMLHRMKMLAQMRENFAFETTLASRGFATWLRDLRTSGYLFHIAFLSLPDHELALARVAERVRLGGHNVKEEVIIRRFALGLRNFFQIYRKIADSWQMFDNSDIIEPRLIAFGKAEKTCTVIDQDAWANLMEKQK